MLKKLEKLINIYSLIIINIILILIVELTGNGKFFVQTGLIHAIAIIFILISIFIIFIPLPLYDKIMKKLIWTSLGAMIIFAASHIAEFIGYMVFNLPDDAVFANVANFYIISIFLILLGAEIFLRIHSGRKSLILFTAYFLVFYYFPELLSPYS